MSGYEYDFGRELAGYKAIMDGGRSDFIPVTTQMAEFCMAHGGLNGHDFFRDPELFVRGSLDVQRDMGFHVPDMVWDVYSVEAEALGGKMAWFDNLYPALDNTEVIIANEKDLARAKAPDPLKTARMPWVMEVLQICRELTGYTHPIHYCSPINLAAQVMQFENLILVMNENPKFVHKLLDFLVEEVLSPYINAYFKVVPDAWIANGKDAVGSLPFITEDILQEFSVPYLDKLRKLCGGGKGIRSDNWWGDSFAENIENYWDVKLHVTPQYLKIQDPDCFRVGTERARAYADTRGCALSFGVGTLLLQNGNKEQITQRVHEYMEVGSRGEFGDKFFLYLCSFSAQTPAENVRYAIDAVNDFNKGIRPYAGEVLSGPDGIAPEIAGGKGFMGIDASGAKASQFRDEDAEQIYKDIFESVMDFDEDLCPELVLKALDMGCDPLAILDEGLIPPMGEVGDLFAAGELFVPEMLLAARAMKAGLAVLKPILTATQSESKGTVVLATVFGDLHDIGKNLVGMMLEGAGFKVIDLGVNTKAETVIETAREVNADVIGLSALLTTTMPFMQMSIKEIADAGLDIPVIVGGAPVTEDFANSINATGYGDNAPIAVNICKKLIGVAQ
ncbi:MAG: cobalamin-dependent protein [Pseudomonadota bacterium]